MRKSDAIEINGILATIPGWKKHNSTQRFGCYGVQKGFFRELDLARYIH
jgi:hypothetical protein